MKLGQEAICATIGLQFKKKVISQMVDVMDT